MKQDEEKKEEVIANEYTLILSLSNGESTDLPIDDDEVHKAIQKYIDNNFVYDPERKSYSEYI